MIPKDEYDPAVHVTAAELRASGIPVPDNIPDLAFVRRGSIIPTASVVDVTADDTAAGRMRATLRFDFTEPFQWIEVDVVLPAAATQPCPECNGTGRNLLHKDDGHADPCGLCNGRGTFAPIALSPSLPCPTCNGSGQNPDAPVNPRDDEAVRTKGTIDGAPILDITHEEMRDGIARSRLRVCSTCNGTGRVPVPEDPAPSGADPCPRCNGSGDDPSSSIGLRYNCIACNGTGRADGVCSTCDGTGRVDAGGFHTTQSCPDCNGSGHVKNLDRKEERDGNQS